MWFHRVQCSGAIEHSNKGVSYTTLYSIAATALEMHLDDQAVCEVSAGVGIRATVRATMRATMRATVKVRRCLGCCSLR